MLKSGEIFKLGEGPINYDWNPRYFVLDGNFIVYILNTCYRGKPRNDLLYQ